METRLINIKSKSNSWDTIFAQFDPFLSNMDSVTWNSTKSFKMPDNAKELALLIAEHSDFSKWAKMSKEPSQISIKCH